MMYLKLIAAVLCFLAWSTPSHSCPVGPSLWCSSVDIAKSCGVQHACFKHVWQKEVTHAVAPPVKVELYYESLCGGCRLFIIQQFYPTFKKIGHIMNITLVPFGNARVINGSNGHSFECQHGPQECVGNKYETCAIFYLKTTDKYLPYVNCIETHANTRNMTQIAKLCASLKFVTADEFKQIDSCANGPVGTQLEYKMAKKTKAAAVPYVPWVVVNGVYNDQIQIAAVTDLLKLVCDTYKGAKPAGCKISFAHTMA